MGRLWNTLFGNRMGRTARSKNSVRLSFDSLEDRLVPSFVTSLSAAKQAATAAVTVATASTDATASPFTHVTLNPNDAAIAVVKEMNQFTDTPVSLKYAEMGGPDSVLGAPTTDVQPTPDGNGLYQQYQNGAIYWSPLSDAHEMHGPIYAKWISLGGIAYGYPKSDQGTLPDGIGQVNDFVPYAHPTDTSSIIESPQTPAHKVYVEPLYGAIRAEWIHMGESGFGYPTDEEHTVADGAGGYGRSQSFTSFTNNANATIVWRQGDTKAHAVYGAIRDKWVSLGGVAYGFPTDDEYTTNGLVARMQDFRTAADSWGRSIVCDPFGTYETHGVIRSTWLDMGGTRVGLPFTDELTGLWGTAPFLEGGWTGARNEYVYSEFWNPISNTGFWIYFKNGDGAYESNLDPGVSPWNPKAIPGDNSFAILTPLVNGSVIDPATLALQSQEALPADAKDVSTNDICLTTTIDEPASNGDPVSTIPANSLLALAQVSVSIDAHALSDTTVFVDGAAYDTANSFTIGLAAGNHAVGTTGGDPISFTVSANGAVSYDSTLEGVLSGNGTNSLSINGVSVQMDASALSGGSLAVDSTVYNSSAPVGLHLLSGQHSLCTYGGTPVPVTVAADGNVSYDPNLEGILSGNGTTSLSVNGVAVQIDASALSGTCLTLDNAAYDSTALLNLQLLPGRHVLKNGSAPISFTVNTDGTVSYDPALEGVFSGSGSGTLAVHGVSLTVDATVLGGTPLNLDSIAYDSSAPLNLNVLPGQHFIQGGDGTTYSFTVNLDGTVNYDPSLDGTTLTGQGTTVLVLQMAM
jgi:hypothetical protein